MHAPVCRSCAGPPRCALGAAGTADAEPSFAIAVHFSPSERSVPLVRAMTEEVSAIERLRAHCEALRDSIEAPTRLASSTPAGR